MFFVCELMLVFKVACSGRVQYEKTIRPTFKRFLVLVFMPQSSVLFCFLWGQSRWQFVGWLVEFVKIHFFLLIAWMFQNFFLLTITNDIYLFSCIASNFFCYWNFIQAAWTYQMKGTYIAQKVVHLLCIRKVNGCSHTLGSLGSYWVVQSLYKHPLEV